MTKEETIDRIKVMQAYVDGKQIQIYDVGKRCWRDIITAPLWDSVAKYRIKPEKKVRPYTFEELCEAVKKHGTMVKSHDGNRVFNISYFSAVAIKYGVDEIDSYIEFKRNVWLDDNSSCGIEEE